MKGASTCVFLVAATCMMVFFIATPVRITPRSPLPESVLLLDLTPPRGLSAQTSRWHVVRRWAGSWERSEQQW
jgi:hypothetical protein